VWATDDSSQGGPSMDGASIEMPIYSMAVLQILRRARSVPAVARLACMECSKLCDMVETFSKAGQDVYSIQPATTLLCSDPY
jgi:hypothetical protein